MKPLTSSPLRKLEFAPSSEIEVTIAPNAGACFGVVRAIKLGTSALEKTGDKVFSLGPLIHNAMVVDELANKGLEVIHEAEKIDRGTVVLRSHGIQKQVEEDLKNRGVKVVDATCPLVKKPQRIAASLGQKGYFLILVGDANHPEVKGVISYFAKSDFMVTYRPLDLDLIPAGVEKVGIIAQTTIELGTFNQIVEHAKARFQEVVVYNTICDATSVRQSEAVELSKKAEVMVIIGGKNSSNTNKLVKICKENQPNTHHIETKSELRREWFENKRKIGITGGASTPQDYVDEIGEYILRMLSQPLPSSLSSLPV